MVPSPKTAFIVDVLIYRLEDIEEWTLEVVDGEGTSTVWDDLFPSGEYAQAEFVRTLKDEGSRAFFVTQLHCIEWLRAVSLATSPLLPRLRAHHLSTEPLGEHLSMLSFGKAEDVEVNTVAIETVAAIAKAHALAEVSQRVVPMPRTVARSYNPVHN